MYKNVIFYNNRCTFIAYFLSNESFFRLCHWTVHNRERVGVCMIDKKLLTDGH